jgi:5-methylcytosine-specific restriction endonuclease McrA
MKKYKRGDIRDDGKYFIQYNRKKFKSGTISYYEVWGTLEDIDRYREYSRKSYQKNREKTLKRCRNYEIKNAEKIAERKSIYYLKNKERINKRQRKYEKFKYYSDPAYRLAVKTRGRIREYIKKLKVPKRDKSHQFLGCNYQFFRQYIEAKFTEGMTWEKFLLGEIHIDHIRPISSFNLLDENELKKAFHYTNCQPLWAKDNLKKKDKWNPKTLALT